MMFSPSQTQCFGILAFVLKQKNESKAKCKANQKTFFSSFALLSLSALIENHLHKSLQELAASVSTVSFGFAFGARTDPFRNHFELRRFVSSLRFFDLDLFFFSI